MRPPEWKPRFEDPEVQTYLFDEAGEEGLDLFAFILENEPITGVEILEAHDDQKPSAVRKVLYQLMQAHALEYDKETDSKGWETFHWRTDLNEIGIILRRRWQDELHNLRKQLKFEEDHQFYACEALHRRMIFEDCVDLGFLCPVCGDAMQPVENKPVLDALQERIDELAPVLEA